MGELVLTQVEGKELLQLKWFISALIANIPAFQYSILPFGWHK
jgi:hypothetical protein